VELHLVVLLMLARILETLSQSISVSQ